MKIAVIGGVGFVGSHLVDALAPNHEIVVVDNFFLGKMSNIGESAKKYSIKIYREDATNTMLLRSILSMEQVDTVINLAMKCLPTSFLDPEGAYMVGVQIAHNWLTCCVRKSTGSSYIFRPPRLTARLSLSR